MKSTCTKLQNMVIGLPLTLYFALLPYPAFPLFDLREPVVDPNRLETHLYMCAPFEIEIKHIPYTAVLPFGTEINLSFLFFSPPLI